MADLTPVQGTPTAPAAAEVASAARPSGRESSTAVPSAAELTAWRAFLRAHAVIARQLEAELVVAHQLPLAWYDVLVQLAEAPDGRLRMTELAERVLLSRSGLTRLVDRLAAEGLVTRAACPSDARGAFAVLTEAGRARLRAAAPTHLRGIAAHMTGRFSPAELEALRHLLVRLTD